MENPDAGKIKEKVTEVQHAIDFLLWKIDRSKDNLAPYMGVIDLQTMKVVQAVKQLKDVVEGV